MSFIKHLFIFFTVPFLLFADLVLVTVPPHKFFVDRITQNTVPVQLMVPAGASSHTYEPTPKQILSAVQGDIWFTIGESFEPKVVRSLQSYNPQMKIVDMRRGMDLIREEGHHHCCAHHTSGEDVHYWVSPKQAKIQARTIYEALVARYPEKQNIFQKGYESFIQELDKLDADFTDILAPAKGRAILVSHPAYAYLIRDYGMKQMSIEFEGKDPTPLQLTKVLREAKNGGVTKVFIQPQYPSKGAQLVAKQIGAKVISLDPYSENYTEEMTKIVKEFASP